LRPFNHKKQAVVKRDSWLPAFAGANKSGTSSSKAEPACEHWQIELLLCELCAALRLCVNQRLRFLAKTQGNAKAAKQSVLQGWPEL
jgi:hypothetical protein